MAATGKHTHVFQYPIAIISTTTGEERQTARKTSTSQTRWEITMQKPKAKCKQKAQLRAMGAAAAAANSQQQCAAAAATSNMLSTHTRTPRLHSHINHSLA